VQVFPDATPWAAWAADIVKYEEAAPAETAVAASAILLAEDAEPTVSFAGHRSLLQVVPYVGVGR
jgi:hypothetical protein